MIQRQTLALGHGMRLAIFTLANSIYRTPIAVVFGITYSLGAFYSGIAFVVTLPTKPFIWMFRRKSSGAGSSDVSIAVPSAVPAAPTPELTEEISYQAPISSGVRRNSGAAGSLRSTFLKPIQSLVSAVRHGLLLTRRSTVTLSMEEGIIRIVAFRGSRVVNWDHVTLIPETENPGDDTETPSDAARFREVLTRLNIRRARLVTDLPLFTSLERHFHLPQAARSYIQPMVISEVLDTIPFSRDEVDISWHSQRISDGHEVVAVAAPRSTIDSQVRFARDAGLTPKGTYSKASALALAAGVPDAILIHNQPLETGVVLVRGGSPIVVHHLETPGPDTTPQDCAASMAVAVDQVLGFYQTLVPGADDIDLPVVMTGQVAGNGAYDEILPRTLGRAVLTCPPPVTAPNGFPASEYAANVGLLLADKAGGRPRGKGPLRMGPTPNLLPERHLPQGLPTKAFLIFFVLILLGAAINPTTVQMDVLVQQADNLTAELGPLRSEVRDRRTDVGLESDARKELETVNRQIAALESRVKDLDDEMVTLLGRLESITNTALPGGVRLASLAPGDGGFALSGNADGHDGILQYAANLRASELFSNATIEEITGSTRESSEGELRFSILATVEEKQASTETDQDGKQVSP